ncbi:MAG: hypothetical protein Q8M16_08360, partial [Pirellulaceae bacterium]|nr:hypothetical protein [Pirellulaceae bacterium]
MVVAWVQRVWNGLSHRNNACSRISLTTLWLGNHLRAGRCLVFVRASALLWLIITTKLLAQEAIVDPATKLPVTNSDSVWKKLGLPEPNPDAPYSKPPTLELLLENDFSVDPRGNDETGTTTEAVAWEPGRLILNDGAKVSWKLQGDNWVELDFKIQFPELAENGQKSELKILLDLHPVPDSYLVLRQMRSDGNTTCELVVFGTPATVEGQERAFQLPQKIRKETMGGPLPSGHWTFRYYGGVWAVNGPGDSWQWSAATENENSQIISA